MLNVLDEGDRAATTLVLIHGFGGSLHWFDGVLPSLAQRYRVVRVDLLGHGDSPKPTDGFSPEAQAEAVEKTLAEIGVDKAVVLGHSLGADVAVALAERSGRVERLILVDEGPDYRVATFPFGHKLTVHTRIGALLHAAATDFAIHYGYRYAFAPGFSVRTAFDDDRIIRDHRQMSFACYRGSLVEKQRFTDEVAHDDRLRKIGLPTLVIFGDEDRFYDSVESCRRFGAVPGVRVEVIPGAGHSPMIESPERFTAAVCGFV